MSSDRFGEIRINPETEEKKPGGHESGSPSRKGKRSTVKKGALRRKRESPRPLDIHERVSPARRHSVVPGWLMLCFAIPLFLALLYAAGSYFLVPSLVKGPLSKSLAANLGRPVSVGRVVFSPFSLEIFLRNVSVGPVYGDLNKKNLLDFPEISCQIDIGGLLQKKLICHEVNMDGVAANLVRLRLGSLNFDDANNFFSLIRGRSGQNLWPEWLVVDGVQLTNGKIVVNDGLKNVRHSIENIRFYLPSSEESREKPESMPSLNAVVNSSPVEVKGRRRKNLEGVMETRFNLKFSGIVLKNYHEYIPTLPQNPFRLHEGQADLDVELVIPELTEGTNKVKVQLDAAIKALRFTDGNDRTILKIPETLLQINAYPARNSYTFKKIEFHRPVFTIKMNGNKDENLQGVTLAELNNLFVGLDEYSYGLRIENFFIHEGVVEVFRGKRKTPLYSFENGQVRLNGFLNKVARQEEPVPPPPAAFWMSSQEKGAQNVRLKADGDYIASGGLKGTFSLNNLDIKRYAQLLPEKPDISEGHVNLSGTYSYSIAAGRKIKQDPKPRWRVDNGELIVQDFVLRRDQKNVLRGKEMICRNFLADGSTEQASCESLTLVKSTINGDAITLSDLIRRQQESHTAWSFTAQNIDIQDSKLSLHVKNPFAREDFAAVQLNNFSLRVEGLQAHDEKNTHFEMSADIGRKGNLLFTGTYSVASGTGKLQTTFRNIPLQEVKSYISPWYSLPIDKGIMDVDGGYTLEEKQFSGKIRIQRFHSGSQDGPVLAWKDAVSDNVRFVLEPLLLNCNEIEIREPHITFGITHPEKPFNSFLKPAHANSVPASVEIGNVRFSDGYFAMPEPVVARGFQPELSGVNGSLSGIGRDLMDFSVRGRFAGQAMFAVQGKTGTEKVNQYTLQVTNVALAPFARFFAANMGVQVTGATGAWKQELQDSETGGKMNYRVELQGISPDPDSRYFSIISLYADENNTIVYNSPDESFRSGEQVFLFDRLFRGIQRDGVRAELSEKLVLKKILPDLALQDNIGFVPGTTTLVVNKNIADYEKLLSKRPFLRLELIGNYDPARDTQAMKKQLQDEADAKREAENKKRAAERQKILEQEKARLAELKKEQTRVIEEEIPLTELTRDLQPLPYMEVEVRKEQLVELARKRAQALYRFFIDGLLVEPARISPSLQTGDTGPEVRVEVHPYLSGSTINEEIGRNDQTAH